MESVSAHKGPGSMRGQGFHRLPERLIHLDSWSQKDGPWIRKAEQGCVHLCASQLCRPCGVPVTSTGCRARQTSCETLAELPHNPKPRSPPVSGVTNTEDYDDYLLHYMPGTMLRTLCLVSLNLSLGLSVLICKRV